MSNERDLSKPICKGYMFKEATGAFHTFNKRFFALYKRYLVYYEKEHDFKKDVASGSLEVLTHNRDHNIAQSNNTFQVLLFLIRK